MGRFDLCINNATIIDGTGADRFVGSIYVDDGKIAAVEPAGAKPAGAEAVGETIDANGKVLAPGFIDAHTHDDLLLLKSPSMLPKLSQGVTTVITGNCGISLAPIESRRLVPPFDLIGDADDFAYATIDAYAQRLDDQPATVNSAMLTGHASLRIDTMDDLDRGATAGEIDMMRRRLDAALQQGSIGMSTGLAYPTARHAPASEVTALAMVLHDHDAIYTSHMRNEDEHLLDAVAETLALGREADVAVVISHHKASGRNNWGKTRESLAMIEQARRSQRVDLDVYPYTASSTVLMPHFVARAERTTVTWSKSIPAAGGRHLEDLCDEWGVDVAEAIERLSPAGAIYHVMADEDVERVLQFETSMIGSDGLPNDERPHPRLWGTFPRVLGYYCRERQLFSLEHAIEKMTSRPAEVFGLEGRGRIAPGSCADLVLFDPDTVADQATYEEPTEASSGIELVLVNGEVAYADGRVTGRRPGRFLRHGR